MRKVKDAPLVLWGLHSAHGTRWLKLAENAPITEMRRRQSEGWKVVRLPRGVSP